jgi:hypothetical protein
MEIRKTSRAYENNSLKTGLLRVPRALAGAKRFNFKTAPKVNAAEKSEPAAYPARRLYSPQPNASVSQLAAKVAIKVPMDE